MYIESFDKPIDIAKKFIEDDSFSIKDLYELAGYLSVYCNVRRDEEGE